MNNAIDLLESFTHAVGLDRYLNQAHIQAWVSIIATVALVLFGLGTFGSSPSTSPSAPGGSSESEVQDAPKAYPIDVDRLVADQEIRPTMLLSLSEVRTNAGLGSLALSTSSTAQKVAENNAQAGAYTGRAVAGRGLLQAALDSSSATAGGFVTAWVTDHASSSVLANASYTTVDIGVASANGLTWAVIILSS